MLERLLLTADSEQGIAEISIRPVTAGQSAKRGTVNHGGNHFAGSAGWQYLIFELGTEEFGTNVMQVKEIMKMQDITAVPQSPHYVQGVINLRGRIVPVMNLRRRFSMPDQPYTEKTCIVVMRTEGASAEQPMGIIVDGVVEVLLLNQDDIEERPDFGIEMAGAHIRGMAKNKGKVKILLDIDKVLNPHDSGYPVAQA